jgi:hypothetical protein
MNERIKQLAAEAKIKPMGSSWTSRFGAEFEEKFAELIVRECADICMEMSAKCAGLDGDGALAKDCAYWIKKDFGVEE